MNQRSDLNQEPTQGGHPSPVGDANRQGNFSQTIPVIEEKVNLDKEVVEKGSVRITKVVSEQEVPVNIPLLQEDHDIQRVAVNQYVDTPPPPLRYEGDTMIIPILQEVLVVEKRLLVVEELRITKHQVQTHETQHISLRKEEIKIERVSPNTADNSSNPV
ncbi:YsnF/AvaK domain-containing protein [Rufibacter radiotolerans]|uniref:YsnF/AvaK domain-containing protein n=1 Tax=Rufibacter radiotolerans TaxID=1379910 RepID=UPI0009E3690B|nr:YsnF/AvaK domain-containing protein [Rufibacter radiotolerans]